MIYVIATCQLIPGKMQEFTDVLTGEIVPVAERHGQKLVGSWQTLVGNLDEVIDLWQFESLAHLEKVRYQSLPGDPEWKKAHARFRALMTSAGNRILSPLALSPILKDPLP